MKLLCCREIIIMIFLLNGKSWGIFRNSIAANILDDFQSSLAIFSKSWLAPTSLLNLLLRYDWRFFYTNENPLYFFLAQFLNRTNVNAHVIWIFQILGTSHDEEGSKFSTRKVWEWTSRYWTMLIWWYGFINLPNRDQHLLVTFSRISNE